MYDVFDYIIIYDMNQKLRILKYLDIMKIIVVKWHKMVLKQFFEKKAGEKMSYNYEFIWISAKSVTSDIKKKKWYLF